MESSIYEGADGLWHGRVTMGIKSDGSPDRRHRAAKTEAEVTRKVKTLEKLRDAGRAPKAGRAPTVETWMGTYLSTIVVHKLKPRTLDDYWSKTRNDIVPGIGQHRLDRLRPEHLDKMYADMLNDGHAPSHVLKVHRILSRALKIALRRELVGRNVATLVDPPTVDEDEINPFTQDEARAFLEAAAKRPTALRWAIGVGFGIRQGEALGLRWAYVDLEAGVMKTLWQLQRLTWRHGCSDPHACGARLHRFEPCPADCTTHKRYKRGCPAPCAATCTRHASVCPERKDGGLVFTRPKTKKSRRTIPLPPPLIPLLAAHRLQQEVDKAAAGEMWEEHDVVFARPDGTPISPRDDWQEFKDLLKEAGLRDARPHDSRHTAGTILNELGVDIRTIMAILGHSQLSMAQRYVHATGPLSRAAVLKMAQSLQMGEAEKPKTETATETGDTRAARARRRRRIQ
ncbi:tyrosine-type recombinase/integrase [Streptomyces sp. H39-C1]|uniref:tyrosine-type recombinase/integrase n=1 Tax=Streptomyces sp. H39-C1 TaxID=3004355 RepID=UPI003FA7DCF0